ncbi:hypothetical protein HCZ23_15550 [Celeribacter sp. HF31]|uniref:hypothetical protein n=1 Tax=Celeribacter sp. HF31 TaxID=2721558 RepID=UPI00142FAEB5|nr:hypothetical protein [Celeribacter sp. HF31]NIY80877.1 hypothetical protein [Celeribacter sp. HF31]
MSAQLLAAAERFLHAGHVAHNAVGDKDRDAFSELVSFEREMLKMRLYLSDREFELTETTFVSVATGKVSEEYGEIWDLEQPTPYSMLLEWAKYIRKKAWHTKDEAQL